jgi:hypothetical protein
MNVAASALADLRTLDDTDDGVLLRTVLNAVSYAEAGFALGLLADRVPQRTLVAALNLRETLRELPISPFAVPVDLDSLARICGLTRGKGFWTTDGEDAGGRYAIEILGQGNLCYDVVLVAGKRRALLKPGPVTEDFVTPEALEMVLEHPKSLRDVIELMTAAGIVYNPRFYMALNEWRQEHAVESLQGLNDLF